MAERWHSPTRSAHTQSGDEEHALPGAQRTSSAVSFHRGHQRVPSTEHSPLLATSHRQITFEGTVVVVLPIIHTSVKGPCYFSLDLPYSLQEDSRSSFSSPSLYSSPERKGRRSEALRFVPAPMYRSRTMELNRLLSSSFEARKSTYNVVILTMLIISGMLALWSFVVASRGYPWIAIIMIFFLLTAAIAVKPLLDGTQCKQLVQEWNHRSPQNLKFQIIGGGMPDTSGDSNTILGPDPELHVIFLDEPSRPNPVKRAMSPFRGNVGPHFEVGEDDELAEENDQETVFVVPDESRDGLMMTVKIVKNSKSSSKLGTGDILLDGGP
ncbi:hypothetical protein HK096_008670 [Nowakowskiella sp. JEL0078]|nr:hypothetical protein HK096_008670 [Nowakowskiella sp. JEL0078]